NAPHLSMSVRVCSLLDTLNLSLLFLFRYIFSILSTEEPNILISIKPIAANNHFFTITSIQKIKGRDLFSPHPSSLNHSAQKAT
ncbi:hypothetical protein, partial [Microcoleus sp. FACHB-SPT15]|uniref:hypothetical protein n=1 Tax=Microcoleus sp. FACHB-SPT15 TaxID=2692830 RepID=UPI001A7EC0E7